MSRIGRTYTRHFDLDAKQHELLGVDLGEGTPRRALILGLILFVGWGGLMLLLFGIPSKFSLTLYLVPPAALTFYGAQRSTKLERRWNFTLWSIAIRYLWVGHRPIICGGRRAATRSEWIGRRARWGAKVEWFDDTPLGPLLDRWLGAEDEIPSGSGAPLRLVARPRLYGPDAVARAYGRKALMQMQEDGK